MKKIVLPVTLLIVDALGGRIEFHSEPGKGTTFYVRLLSPAPNE